MMILGKEKPSAIFDHCQGRASKSFVLQRKEFVYCKKVHDVVEVAKKLAQCCCTVTPDAIVSFVTGTSQFESWKRDDFRSAFAAGLVKARNV